MIVIPNLISLPSSILHSLDEECKIQNKTQSKIWIELDLNFGLSWIVQLHMLSGCENIRSLSNSHLSRKTLFF